MSISHCRARRRLVALAATTTVATLAGLASPGLMAQGAFPSKAITMVVPYPPGGSNDVFARQVAKEMGDLLKQAVIVDNRPGASGNTGTASVAKAAADGYTLVAVSSSMTTNAAVQAKMPFDPVKDLQPVSLIGVAPLVLVAPAGAPEGRAFLEAAAQAGSRWSYGSPGVGTVGHLGMELLKSRSALRPEHIPYPGYPQVFNAIQGGDLQLSMLPPALAMAQVQAGKLRGVAVTSAARSPLAPGLPSLKELGVGDFDLEIWNAVAAPKAMPAAHVQKLAEAVSEIARSPEMRARLAAQGWQAVGSSPEGLSLRIRQDVTALGRIIREQGIHAQ